MPTVVGPYEVTRKIGEGGYGKIFLARRLARRVGRAIDDDEVVLKQVKLPTNKLEREMCLREVSIMKGAHHPCVLECTESFVDGGSVYIAMPHCTGGDLASLLRRHKKRGRRVPERVVLDWFAQIILGVEHLHSHDTLHRDLKSQNVFLRRDHLPVAGGAHRDEGAHASHHRGRSRVALGDFGIARELRFDDGGGGADAMARTFVGTPVFMAPEMFKRKPYDHKADVWAAGCVLYEMMQLSEPFRARTMGELTRLVQHQKPKPLPSEYGADLRDLCARMLAKNPDDRPTAREVIRDFARLREACGLALRDAGVTREALAAVGDDQRAMASTVVPAFDAVAMARRGGDEMRLPQAASTAEHEARALKTAAKQARRCGIDVPPSADAVAPPEGVIARRRPQNGPQPPTSAEDIARAAADVPGERETSRETSTSPPPPPPPPVVVPLDVRARAVVEIARRAAANLRAAKAKEEEPREKPREKPSFVVPPVAPVVGPAVNGLRARAMNRDRGLSAEKERGDVAAAAAAVARKKKLAVGAPYAAPVARKPRDASSDNNKENANRRAPANARGGDAKKKPRHPPVSNANVRRPARNRVPAGRIVRWDKDGRKVQSYAPMRVPGGGGGPGGGCEESERGGWRPLDEHSEQDRLAAEVAALPSMMFRIDEVADEEEERDASCDRAPPQPPPPPPPVSKLVGGVVAKGPSANPRRRADPRGRRVQY